MRKLEGNDRVKAKKFVGRTLKNKYKAIQCIGKKDHFEILIFKFKCWKCWHTFEATWEQAKSGNFTACECGTKPKPTPMLLSPEVKCLGRIKEKYESLMIFEFKSLEDGRKMKAEYEKTYKWKPCEFYETMGKARMLFFWKHSELTQTYLNRRQRHGDVANGSNEWWFGAQYFEPSIFVDGKKDYDNPEIEAGDLVRVQFKEGKNYPHRIYI